MGANIRLGDDPTNLPSTMRAQAEPHIARSPTNPDFLLGVFQDGRFVDGGAVDCGYAVSHDGGLTWTRALIPYVSTTSGGPYLRATDPVAGIDLNGRAFLNTIGATNSQFTTGAILVSRSLDGGLTFEPPAVIYQSPSTSFFPDKNWMAINNFASTPTAGRIVVAFALFGSSKLNGAPIVRSYSDDAGEAWSPIAQIAPSAQDTQGAQPVFLANGKLAIVYWNFNGTTGFNDDFMQVVISDDGGVTFGPPKFITKVSRYAEPQIRSDGFLPNANSDRVGNLFVVYQATFAGSPRIMFTKSTNNGDSWSTPVPISDNPPGSGVFNPAVAASPDGQTLTITFYDHRNNPGSTTMCDMYLAQSFDGGATWQPNIRLTSTSTDASLAPRTDSGYMLGDYLGIAEPTNADVPAVPIWVDTRTGNPDPFVARVGIAPAPDYRSWQAAHLSLGQINDPSTGGPNGDADHDGANNQAEFLADTDPNQHAARQLNISTRAQVGTGDNVAIAGFIISGTEPKRILVRGIGPSLGAFGIAGALQDPTLRLVPQNGTPITNDNWFETDAALIQATGHPPTDSREAAIVQTLSPGTYTAVVSGKNNSTGVALAEVYDVDTGSSSELGNLSGRALVGVDDNVVIGGLIIGDSQGTGGASTVRVLIRGTGPSLSAFGVADALQNPELTLFDGNGVQLATNDDWRQTQETEIAATGKAPKDDRESAILTTLSQGSYTAILRGRDSTTGVGLLEAFTIP
ncbi:MAG: sialidase family protein [Chthoniobacterales bacterium]